MKKMIRYKNWTENELKMFLKKKSLITYVIIKDSGGKLFL